MNQKVLIVDDHPIVLDGLKTMVNQIPGFEVVGALSSVDAAIKYLKMLDVGIVITDIEMPDKNGFDLIRELKKMSKAKIMVLSMHSEKSFIQEAMKMGVDGYVLKDSDRDDMIQALETVAAGKRYYSPTLLEKGFSAGEQMGKPEVNLTKRELDVLVLLAEGMSNREVGEKLFLSPKTIDSHRTSLMRKLEVNNVVGLVRYAIKQGLID